MKYIFTITSLITCSGSLMAMNGPQPNIDALRQSMDYLRNMNREQFVHIVRPLITYYNDDERLTDFYSKHLGAIYNAAQNGDIDSFKHHFNALHPQIK